MKAIKTIIFTGLTVIMTQLSINAALFDFSDTAPAAPGFTNWQGSGINVYDQAGFRITPNTNTGMNFHDVSFDNEDGIAAPNPSGGDYLTVEISSNSITITDISSTPFTLNSFEGGGLYGESPTATVTGNFAGGGSTSESINLLDVATTGAAFQTFDFDPDVWTNLDSVVIERTSGFFVGFDNITLNDSMPAVPEPSTYLLFATMILGAGLFAIRRRKIEETAKN